MLVADGVSAYYRTRSEPVRAVDGVSLTIGRNEIVGIAGESGCGKSTLLKVLYDAIESPLELVAGRVRLALPGTGAHLESGEIARAWWDAISYIPQASMSVLNPVLRVGGHFSDSMARRRAASERRELQERIPETLRQLRLPDDVLDAYPHQLSGGMRQRVVVALATFMRPRIVLADEPTTALDVVIQKEILTLMVDLQRRMENTLVLVSHDLAVHFQVTDRIVVMYAGRIAESGPTSAVFGEPRHPYTRLLIESLPRIGDRSRRSGITGLPPSLRSPPPGCAFAPRCPFAIPRCAEEVPAPRRVSDAHEAACHLCEPEHQADG